MIDYTKVAGDLEKVARVMRAARREPVKCLMSIWEDDLTRVESAIAALRTIPSPNSEENAG
ncbi:MAG: hypothetical protein JWL86_801 [Rhizobium sp.]|nr:hypothetical protein [Rhizobium sp.]